MCQEQKRGKTLNDQETNKTQANQTKYKDQTKSQQKERQKAQKSHWDQWSGKINEGGVRIVTKTFTKPSQITLIMF